MAPPSSSAFLLTLLAAFLAFQVQLVVCSSETNSTAAILSGSWTAFPGKSIRPAPASVHLDPDGLQVTVQRDGVTLRQNVTGLIQGGFAVLRVTMLSHGLVGPIRQAWTLAAAEGYIAFFWKVYPAPNRRRSDLLCLHGLGSELHSFAFHAHKIVRASFFERPGSRVLH